jgi:hypothetical protein
LAEEIDWHMVDDELFAHVIEELKAMGRFLYGRISWSGEGTWPAFMGVRCIARRSPSLPTSSSSKARGSAVAVPAAGRLFGRLLRRRVS